MIHVVTGTNRTNTLIGTAKSVDSTRIMTSYVKHNRVKHHPGRGSFMERMETVKEVYHTKPSIGWKKHMRPMVNNSRQHYRLMDNSSTTSDSS